MPMRFNQKELIAIASKNPEEFDKEGVLFLKEKEGNLFHKSESYSEKFFRLKGNLLFYFKTKYKNSDLVGVIVLERCKVTPQASGKEFGFTLEFAEEEEQKYELGAKSGNEMDSWIEALKGASYEKLRSKLIGLRNEIMETTGQDPLPDYHPIVEQNPTPSCRVSLYSPLIDLDDADCQPILEICIACTDLKSQCEGSKPMGFVKVYAMTPPDMNWAKISQTEVAEEGSDPDFLKNIIIHGNTSAVTRLKFVVFDVRSKSKQDVSLLGQAVCTVKEIQGTMENRFTLTLMNADSSDAVGKLHLQAWKRERSGSRIRRLDSAEFHHLNKANLLSFNKHIRTYITNVMERSFRFPTSDNKDLRVQEFMGESLLTFRIPQQLLALFIKEEKDAVVELHNLGTLHPEWENIKNQLQNSHFSLVRKYSTAMAELSQYDGKYFKKSSEKQDPDFEFISTNLHLQRTRVVTASEEEFTYDIVTVGVPTAYPQKYRHGGLKKMLAAAEETSRRMTLSPGDSEKTRASIKVRNMKLALKKLGDSIKEISSELTNCENIDGSVESAAEEISNKVGELLNIHCSSFMCDIETSLMTARVAGPFQNSRSSGENKSKPRNSCQWQWSGTEFRTSLTIVSDLDCGVRDNLAKMMATVHNVINDINDQQSGKEEEFRTCLAADTFSLVMACESLIKKLIVSMSFILLQEEAGTIMTMKDLRHRRDVVFSQALTPAIAGFVVKLSENIHNQTFLEQVSQLGVLVHLESLLTPYGDEMGMMEDMVIAMRDLKKVFFTIVQNDSEDCFPVVTGNRCCIIVEIPLHSSLFTLLPMSLQQKQRISLVPVVFNIGINEQAILAERFGDLSLQEEINNKNLNVLYSYYSKFIEKFPDWVGHNSGQEMTLAMLLTHLQILVQSKKNKNYDILLVSEEICWRLNSIRITSCKSAKDRSSMAVTLEIAKILEREHKMQEQVFYKVLATLRSQGTRLANVHKNIGFAKYAFNMVQARALPYDYRPQEGTYGKHIQT